MLISTPCNCTNVITGTADTLIAVYCGRSYAQQGMSNTGQLSQAQDVMYNHLCHNITHSVPRWTKYAQKLHKPQ